MACMNDIKTTCLVMDDFTDKLHNTKYMYCKVLKMYHAFMVKSTEKINVREYRTGNAKRTIQRN